MKEFKLPENYQTVMPYLIVRDASGLKQFMIDVFGGRELKTHLRDGEPGIMHAEVQIGDSTIMFGDCSEQWPPITAGLYINVADADATYALALSKGAKSIMAPVDQPYGRSGGIHDPFGNVWWITSPL
ncbi:VOC family protein [Paraflavitalea sp. CAU 1676]|uniref:VOC family protein n=1 Tax=Paraflavitalea sp. CAU 1676 TaxID=3032598 RepID=UPI0023DA41CD|nr:VOC family protein [Paraflavitalea sp. CAU 1676]MDF2188810.1 VOC family protein [Paraflavitalea sp. CAU 1676]